MEGEAQEGVIGLQEFIDNGGYQVERKPWANEFSNSIGYGLIFIADPEANPRKTPSGKLEICSQSKADLFNSFGFIDWDYKPYPEYITPNTGYETTFKDGKIGGEKGEYPYRCTISTTCAVVTPPSITAPGREAWPNPVYINASDAAELGIKTGDTALISTKTAQALRKASVTQSMMPGRWCPSPTRHGVNAGRGDRHSPQRCR